MQLRDISMTSNNVPASNPVCSRKRKPQEATTLPEVLALMQNCDLIGQDTSQWLRRLDKLLKTTAETDNTRVTHFVIGQIMLLSEKLMLRKLTYIQRELDHVEYKKRSNGQFDNVDNFYKEASTELMAIGAQILALKQQANSSKLQQAALTKKQLEIELLTQKVINVMNDVAPTPKLLKLIPKSSQHRMRSLGQH
jgi:hypothetical protein